MNGWVNKTRCYVCVYLRHTLVESFSSPPNVTRFLGSSAAYIIVIGTVDALRQLGKQTYTFLLHYSAHERYGQLVIDQNDLERGART